MRLSWSARTRYLVLAATSAALAGTLTFIYLSGLDRRLPVVVAERAITAYTVLDGTMLRTVFLPPAAVHPDALARPVDAIGRTSLVPRAPGEQILAGSLTDGSEPGRFRAGLAPEERALYLPAEVILGHWVGLEIGDYLDLTVVLDGASHCVAQGVEVVGILEAPRGLGPGVPEAPLGVFLRLTPGERERVTLALEYGQVYYSLYGYSGVPVPSAGAWLEQLHGGEGEGSFDDTWPGSG